MDYKKIKEENYNLHLIKTDRFKEIVLSLRFTSKYDKEKSAYLKLLERILVQGGTKKYKKLKDLSRELEYLYKSNISSRFFATSKNMTFETRLSMINPKYTEEDIYQKTFALFKEVLTNPKIENNKWDEEVFNLEKENLIKSIKNVKDSPEIYGRIKFEEIFFKGTVYAENNYKNIKTFENLKNEKLFTIYKELFNNYKIDIFVIGDFEEEIIINEVSKLMGDFKQKDNTVKNLQVKIKQELPKETKEKIETSASNLFIGCTLKDLTEDERKYKLILYNTILGTMNNSVLFVNVREKHSLCYHIGSILNRFTDTIVIDSGIDAKNYEKTIKLVEESLNSMTDIKTVNKLITNAKKTLEISYNDFYENIMKIIDYYYLNEFTDFPTIEKRKEEIFKTTGEEICELAKKVEIKSVYLLEGSLNEKN